MARQIVFRIRDLPESASVKHEIVPSKVVPRRRCLGRGGNQRRGGPTGLLCRSVQPAAKDVTEFRLRVAMAAGPWQHVVETEDTDSSCLWLTGRQEPCLLADDAERVGNVGCRDPQFPLRGHTLDCHRQEWPATEANPELVPRRWRKSSADDLDVFRAGPFPIDHFEFQTRRFEWVEIPGLPVSASPQRKEPRQNLRQDRAEGWHARQRQGMALLRFHR